MEFSTVLEGVTCGAVDSLVGGGAVGEGVGSCRPRPPAGTVAAGVGFSGSTPLIVSLAIRLAPVTTNITSNRWVVGSACIQLGNTAESKSYFGFPTLGSNVPFGRLAAFQSIAMRMRERPLG